MGVAEIIGFAACWLVVASLMLWGVFTERRRGAVPLLDGRSSEPRGNGRPALNEAAQSGADMHPSRLGRPSPYDWIVVEATEGGTPEVAQNAKFLASAWLASRGVDIDSLPPADLRIEVTSTGDGAATTRILVRAGALAPSRRSRKA